MGSKVGIKKVALDLLCKESPQTRKVAVVPRRKLRSADSKGWTLSQVMYVQMRSLGDGPPFSVEKNQGGETIRVGVE